ncbi:ParB/RepB/Spo0J family partition protein [Pelagibacteraceae bacterium]|jgi:ParB family transcriptional regulator, chromosome partitioning protein|nr:ParB/RepB/Spo0J family partition protein [Pelagibacteraceae bacterium]
MNETKKKGLGRGLSSLFGDAKQTEDNVEKNELKSKALISDLNRNKFQPRINFDEKKLSELSNSIKKNGLIQPIAVRVDSTDSNKFEIIAGERRWLAAQKAGLHEVPIVIHDLSDNETLEVAIVENIQREDLNSIEEARGYERLGNEFRYDQDKIAKMMSKSRSHISNTLRLLSLPDDVISMLEDGQLNPGQARPLIGLSDSSSIAEEIVKKNMSARSVEALAKAKKGNLLNKKTDSNIEAVKKEIEDKLGLKVSISNKKNNSGRITIVYKDLSQFELVSNLLKRN